MAPDIVESMSTSCPLASRVRRVSLKFAGLFRISNSYFTSKELISAMWSGW